MFLKAMPETSLGQWLTWTTKPSPVDPGATNQSVPTSAERMFSIGNFELSRLLLTFTTLGWIGPVQSNRKINAYLGENTNPYQSFLSLHGLLSIHRQPPTICRARAREVGRGEGNASPRALSQKALFTPWKSDLKWRGRRVTVEVKN